MFVNLHIPCVAVGACFQQGIPRLRLGSDDSNLLTPVYVLRGCDILEHDPDETKVSPRVQAHAISRRKNKKHVTFISSVT